MTMAKKYKLCAASNGILIEVDERSAKSLMTFAQYASRSPHIREMCPELSDVMAELERVYHA